MNVQSSIEEFLERLASADPTPGGGSAAAIMGAMGAALVSMVCNVTLGKKVSDPVTAEMQAVRAETDRLRQRLTALIAEDIDAFDNLMAAYRLPKNTDDEKARRTDAIQSSLRRATEVPLECARISTGVMGLASRAGRQGHRGVVSDAGVGVVAANAALRSAALNVYINAPALKDRLFAEQSVTEINELVRIAAVECEAVYTNVRDRLET